MKKIVYLSLLLVLIIVTQSCNKDSEVTREKKEPLDSNEASIVNDTDKQTDQLLDIIDIYAFNAINGQLKSNQLPSCVSTDIVQNGGSVTVTLVFDSSGCLMPDGNTYSGTLIFTRSVSASGQQLITGSLLYDDFYMNETHIVGSVSYERQQANTNGYQQTTANYDIIISLPNGEQIESSGTRIREWIAGYDTFAVYVDDVFLITGNAHYLLQNGTQLDILISTPLRRESPCLHYVSGTIVITKNTQTSVLDYGSGNCDNEASLTLPDGTIQIVYLGN